MKKEYEIIFNHPIAILEWVNEYTLILKIEGPVLLHNCIVIFHKFDFFELPKELINL